LVFWAAATPCFAQFAGPSVLSRGEAPSAISTAAVKFRPFVGLSGNYDTGVAGVELNGNGQLTNQAVYGVSLSWGISGSHLGKRTAVGLTYRGSYANYRARTALGSIDQSIIFSVTERLSRRVTVGLNTTAGIYSRDFGLLGLPQSVPFDPTTTYIPTTDFFDNRTYYSTSQLFLTYQRSARLSFSSAGGAYLTRRRSPSLYGTTGISAGEDVQYRLNRRTTVGGTYTYEHFTAIHVYGTTDLHGVSGSFARQITRHGEFSGFAGMVRPELKFIRSVPVDPVIAALLGVTSAAQISHSVSWTPMGSGRLSWVFSRGVAFLSAGHTVTPGNGLFLTTKMSSCVAGYVYTGLRRWTFNFESGYRSGSSIQNLIGRYKDASASLTISRSLSHGFHWYASGAARKYWSPNFPNYDRRINQASIGFGYSPGELPLRVW
jgi:hypothetical protein